MSQDDQLLSRVRGLLQENTISTPSYVYFLDEIEERCKQVAAAFSDRFRMSYAVKSNPNASLLSSMRPHIDLLDASSIAEVEYGLAAGYAPEVISFSGPAKRQFELERCVEIGTLKVVVESADELATLNQLAHEAGKTITILLRLNPLQVPKSFGINMAGAASPFGFDEESLDAVVPLIAAATSLNLVGFHIYSATNSTKESAIADNFAIFVKLFDLASKTFDIEPEHLIFGAGFGIPYAKEGKALDLVELKSKVEDAVSGIDSIPRLAKAHCVLELGRFLVGPAGYFLTQVLVEKDTRGKKVRICDGGMNNHLAACGLMGMFLRRPWPMWNVTSDEQEDEEIFTLTGPLCTTIDTLAKDVPLQGAKKGDIIAVGMSGAYGFTASPNNFISHPAPQEYVVTGDTLSVA